MLFIQFHQQMPEIWAPQRKTCVFNIVFNGILTWENIKKSTLNAYISANTARRGMCSTSFQRKKCGESFQRLKLSSHVEPSISVTGAGGWSDETGVLMTPNKNYLKMFSTLFPLT